MKLKISTHKSYLMAKLSRWIGRVIGGKELKLSTEKKVGLASMGMFLTQCCYRLKGTGSIKLPDTCAVFTDWH